MRPDDVNFHAQANRSKRADYRHETRALEELQKRRQFRFVKFFVQHVGHETDDHPAENAGFQRLNAHAHALTCRQQIIFGEFARDFQRGVNRRVRHQHGQKCREPDGASVRACQTDGKSHGEKYRQVRENGVARVRHDQQEILNPVDVEERERRQRVRVRQRAADTQSQTHCGQNRYRQHECSAEFLQPGCGLMVFFRKEMFQFGNERVAPDVVQ